MAKEQENLSSEIVEAITSGVFLDFVYKASRDSEEQGKQIVDHLVALHNAGAVDIINEFNQLKNLPSSGYNFFLTRNLFAHALPRLSAPVLSVMNCVQHLVNESGQDMSAGWLFPPFTEFCGAEPVRVSEALDIAMTFPEQWSDFLSPALRAGSAHDMELYFQKALQLCLHANAAIRRNAVHALGSYNFPDGSVFPNRAIDILKEQSVQENDDQVLCCLISSACQLCIADNSLTTKGIEIINSVLAKGGVLALHTASDLFAYKMNHLPEEMVDSFMPFLLEVAPEHAGTVRNIGFGITVLLKRIDPTKGIEFLESLLVRHQGNITIESLDHLVHSIDDHGHALLNKLLTRWFCTGDFVLCNSISSILNVTHNDDIPLEIDMAEIPSNDPVLFLFIARKAIGFLFLKPVTCCSIILSLMKNTQDQELIRNLSWLLFDPILLNFSGKPYGFLKEKIETTIGPVQEAVHESIAAIDNYLDTLRAMPEIPEMFPSQKQQEAKSRHHSQKIAESFKETQKESIFNLMCSKSLLLYGNASVMQIRENGGQARRIEIPMQHHSISMEIPRQGDIDPFSFDYKLRVFRNERIVSR